MPKTFECIIGNNLLAFFKNILFQHFFQKLLGINTFDCKTKNILRI